MSTDRTGAFDEFRDPSEMDLPSGTGTNSKLSKKQRSDAIKDKKSAALPAKKTRSTREVQAAAPTSKPAKTPTVKPISLKAFSNKLFSVEPIEGYKSTAFAFIYDFGLMVLKLTSSAVPGLDEEIEARGLDTIKLKAQMKNILSVERTMFASEVERVFEITRERLQPNETAPIAESTTNSDGDAEVPVANSIPPTPSDVREPTPSDVSEPTPVMPNDKSLKNLAQKALQAYHIEPSSISEEEPHVEFTSTNSTLNDTVQYAASDAVNTQIATAIFDSMSTARQTETEVSQPKMSIMDVINSIQTIDEYDGFVKYVLGINDWTTTMGIRLYTLMVPVEERVWKHIGKEPPIFGILNDAIAHKDDGAYSKDVFANLTCHFHKDILTWASKHGMSMSDEFILKRHSIYARYNAHIDAAINGLAGDPV